VVSDRLMIVSRPVALVAGVGRRSGIGAAVARRLGAAGVDLFLHTWSPADAEQTGGRSRRRHRDPGGDRRGDRRPGGGVRGRPGRPAGARSGRRCRRRRVRPRRRAGRRPRPQQRAGPGAPDGRGAGPQLRGEHPRHPAAGPAVRPPARRRPPRAGRAAHLGPAPRADARRAALHRVQGGVAPGHGEPRGPPRARQDHREHRRPGRHRHRLAGRGDPGRGARVRADGPLGRAGRRGVAARVAGRAGRRLGHRSGDRLLGRGP